MGFVKLGLEESWKDIPGYEGKYQISNMGNVKTIGRYSHSKYSKRWVEEAIKKKTVDKDGYNHVCLSNAGGTKSRFSIHRLVASAFIVNHGNRPCVNHINGIKTDNRVENLEWATYSENNAHAFRVLGRVHPKGMLGKTFKKKPKNDIFQQT